jgi:hypothetical protein
LPLSEGHSIEIHFPIDCAEVDDAWMDIVADVLAHLAEMDNAVQRISADQCARSGYDPINYESELAYISILRPDSIALHYDGTVNTEWDEGFQRING